MLRIIQSFFLPIFSLPFLISLTGVVGICCILAHYSYGSRSSCEIEFTLKTQIPTDFSVYYDIGEGLSQKYYQQKRIDYLGEKTIISFCIASYQQLLTIRFDPAMTPIAMDIYSILLRYSDGTSFRVPFDTLQAGEQILKYSWDDSKLSFTTTPDANDPTFVLTKLNDGVSHKNSSQKILYYTLWILTGTFIASLGRFMIHFFWLGH